ncbi:MAG: 3-oxoacyl-ACP synthase [Flammeovirgaceae bacterium]|nr:3-oxoacyl-ACP synthase [Flammeovirgaceae bacterium]MBR08491.1 3-oxoacyl-ACP synthase [Rickettsiales bacterium]HCX21943.1 3-oxoacyl-ACP synthase [Cytophagales bacterium]|tara:strand:- start:3637 stop:4635 length:999 start_codon:yes stop_codon:yes gene_type:complete
MAKIRAAITGVQGYVPDYVLTNQELETMVDTNDEWIQSRTGIVERRILKGENQGTSVIGAEAVKGLLEKTGTDPLEIDMIICATVTPDMPFPATANIVADMVGAKNSFGYDLSAACSGFLYGLATGASFIESGAAKKVIVIGADKMSSIIDYTDRTTCIIFGDGGGAVLLEPTEEEVGVMDSILKSDGSGAPYLHMKAGGSRKPATPETVAAREHYAYQEGSTVFKFAVTNMADVAAEVMERNNLSGDDIAWLVPHQANKRIIDATARRMNVGDDKVMLNIQRYGNTTAGTLPLCLWDYESQLKKGDNIILAAFGGGFTWGATWLKWAYDPK